jgi:hypothetical protein
MASSYTAREIRMTLAWTIIYTVKHTCKSSLGLAHPPNFPGGNHVFRSPEEFMLHAEWLWSQDRQKNRCMCIYCGNTTLTQSEISATYSSFTPSSSVERAQKKEKERKKRVLANLRKAGK